MVMETMVLSLTWSSDIYSIFQIISIQHCDINLSNLSLDLESYVPKKDRPKYLFLTHAQGFKGLSKNFRLLKNKIYLIEDVCESHGASFNNKKLGSYGIASNFSFYYAHHMTQLMRMILQMI